MCSSVQLTSWLRAKLAVDLITDCVCVICITLHTKHASGLGSYSRQNSEQITEADVRNSLLFFLHAAHYTLAGKYSLRLSG